MSTTTGSGGKQGGNKRGGDKKEQGIETLSGKPSRLQEATVNKWLESWFAGFDNALTITRRDREAMGLRIDKPAEWVDKWVTNTAIPNRNRTAATLGAVALTSPLDANIPPIPAPPAGMTSPNFFTGTPQRPVQSSNFDSPQVSSPFGMESGLISTRYTSPYAMRGGRGSTSAPSSALPSRSAPTPANASTGPQQSDTDKDGGKSEESDVEFKLEGSWSPRS